MKTDLGRAKALAEQITDTFFNSGYGETPQYQGMLELSRTKIADMIEDHDKEILKEAHEAHVQAVTKCGN